MIRGKIYEIARIIPIHQNEKITTTTWHGSVEFLPSRSEFYFTVIDLFRLNFKRLSITILEIIRIDVA